SLHRLQRRPLWALLTACAAVFAALSVDVTYHGPIASIDPRVALWCDTHVRGAAHAVFAVVTRLGDPRLEAVLVLVALVVLAKARRFLDGALVVLAPGIASGLTTVLKDAFRRPQPMNVHVWDSPTRFSFPSGHAANAFAIYVLLAILLTPERWGG